MEAAQYTFTNLNVLYPFCIYKRSVYVKTKEQHSNRNKYFSKPYVKFQIFPFFTLSSAKFCLVYTKRERKILFAFL